MKKSHSGSDIPDPSASGSMPFQKRSILDPHFSVLQLLERNGCEQEEDVNQAPSQIPVELKSAFNRPLSPHKRYPEALNQSISDSWQSIKMVDYSILNSLHDTSSSQAVGILSSSDTSEEELDHLNSPSPSSQQVFPNGPSFSFQTQAGVPTASATLPTPGVLEEDDNETVTVSLAASSNSFVMPQLSLSQRSHRFEILVVGKPARKFWNSVPKMYQKMFDVGDFESISTPEVSHYTAVMIIFQDTKEVSFILDSLVTKLDGKAIIPICQRGQKQQLASSLEPFVKAKKIRLMFQPTVMSNHQEIHKLLRYLHRLSTEIDSGYETDETHLKVRKRKKTHKKKSKGTSNRWVIWGLSLTVGVGIGCCISFILSSYSSGVQIPHASRDDVVLVEEVPTLPDNAEGNGPIGQVITLLRRTVKQFNLVLKQFIYEQVGSLSWIQRVGKELISEDSDSTVGRVAALDLVLL